jgi:hypothetical protein
MLTEGNWRVLYTFNGYQKIMPRGADSLPLCQLFSGAYFA